MSFESDMANFIKQTTQAIDLALQDVVIAVGDSVVTLSPVLTGRFKGNWQFTIGSPANASLIAYDPEGDVTLQRIISTAGTFTAGEIGYIVNNLTYAYDLEAGRSNQAPGGIVRVTEVQFEEFIKEAVARRKVG